MPRRPSIGWLPCATLAFCLLAPEAAGAQDQPSYVVMTPQPLLAEPAPPSPSPSPGAGLLPIAPAAYEAPASTPRPIVGLLPHTVPLEISANGRPATSSYVPGLPVGYTPQAMGPVGFPTDVGRPFFTSPDGLPAFLGSAHRPGPRRDLAVAGSFAFVGETAPNAGIDLAPAAVPHLGLVGRFDLDDTWGLAGRLGYMGYTIVDTQAAGSQHHRDELDLTATACYTLPVDLGRISLGAGYTARGGPVSSNLPASLTAPLPFVTSQLFHGPVLQGSFGYLFTPAWRLDLALEARPYLITTSNAALAQLAPLFGYGAVAGVTWSPAEHAQLRLGYRLDYDTGYSNDFFHSTQGPEASLEWGF